MAEAADTLRPTAEQYRERAKLFRQQAAAMKSPLRRQELIDLADQCDRLADTIERGAVQIALRREFWRRVASVRRFRRLLRL
jgi:uncharacterized protein Yka (UPF0111/DUF47 family)